MYDMKDSFWNAVLLYGPVKNNSSSLFVCKNAVFAWLVTCRFELAWLGLHGQMIVLTRFFILTDNQCVAPYQHVR